MAIYDHSIIIIWQYMPLYGHNMPILRFCFFAVLWPYYGSWLMTMTWPRPGQWRGTENSTDLGTRGTGSPGTSDPAPVAMFMHEL